MWALTKDMCIWITRIYVLNTRLMYILFCSYFLLKYNFINSIPLPPSSSFCASLPLFPLKFLDYFIMYIYNFSHDLILGNQLGASSMKGHYSSLLASLSCLSFFVSGWDPMRFFPFHCIIYIGVLLVWILFRQPYC